MDGWVKDETELDFHPADCFACEEELLEQESPVYSAALQEMPENCTHFFLAKQYLRS